MSRLAAWFGCVAAFGLLAGCGPKVDCDALGGRLDECTQELMFTLNPGAKQQLAKTVEAEQKKENEKLLVEDIARNRMTLKAQVTDKCKAHKGRAADAKLIQKCLAEGAKDCQKFASCFASYLKNKSK